MRKVHRTHTHMSKDHLTFGHEMMDILDLLTKQVEVVVDFAEQQIDQIQWRIYEEDLDGRVERFLEE